VIFEAAQHPTREVIAGGAGVKLSAARFAPRMADLYMERRTFADQQTDMPVSDRADNLYAPVADDGGARGRNWKGHTRRSSLYSAAVMHPRAAAAGLLGVAALIALTLQSFARGQSPSL
jgi:hypothetical protein